MAAKITPSTDVLLCELVAKQSIVEVLYLYARGWDRMDEAQIRACFHADSTHKHAGFEGPSSKFIDFGIAVCSGVKSMSHMIFNPIVTVKGEAAISECSYLAHHRRIAVDNGGQDGSDEEDMFIKGRFLDRFERREGQWRIARREAYFDFERIVPPADRTLAGLPEDQMGHYKPDDALYALIAAF